MSHCALQAVCGAAGGKDVLHGRSGQPRGGLTAANGGGRWAAMVPRRLSWPRLLCWAWQALVRVTWGMPAA